MAKVNTGLGWRANDSYLVSAQNELIATVLGREFTKTNAGYAVAVSTYPSTTGFSGPILLSTVQSYAWYTAYGMECGSSIACHYAGFDWYMTAFGIWMAGNTNHNTDGKAPEWSMTGFTPDQTEAIALDILQTAGVEKVPEPRFIEYVQANGAQYINTGIIPSGMHKAEIRSRIHTPSTNWDFLFGERSSGDYLGRFSLRYGNTLDGELQAQKSPNPSANFETVNGTYKTTDGQYWHTYYVGNYFAVDGKSKGNFTTQSNNNSPFRFPIYLFAADADNAPADFGYVQCEYFRMWDSTNHLVINLVPALDENDEVCMYDTVSENYFYNQGSGDLIGGNAIHFTNLTHIESTGTQFINSEFYPSGKSEIEIRTKQTQTRAEWDTLWGTRDGQNARFSARFGNTANGELQVQKSPNPSTAYEYRDVGVYKTTDGLSWHTYYMGSVFKFDGVQKGSAFSTGTSDKFPYPLLLLAVNHAGEPLDLNTAQIASCKLWEDGTLERDFIPIINWNGVVCLYDNITKTCYYNEGSGVFVAGDPIVDTKYLLQDGNGDIWKVSGGSLVQVIGTLNAQMFINNGMDSVPNWNDYSSLTDPSILCWNAEEIVDMVATTTGLPSAQSITTAGIAVSPQGADGIDTVEITDVGNPKYAFSVDDGSTWKVLSGGAWVTSSGIASDMSSADVEALTSTEWDLLTSGATFIKIRFALFASTDAVESITVNYSQV